MSCFFSPLPKGTLDQGQREDYLKKLEERNTRLGEIMATTIVIVLVALLAIAITQLRTSGRMLQNPSASKRQLKVAHVKRDVGLCLLGSFYLLPLALYGMAFPIEKAYQELKKKVSPTS